VFEELDPEELDPEELELCPSEPQAVRARPQMSRLTMRINKRFIEHLRK
jgi:hypothetical protein